MIESYLKVEQGHRHCLVQDVHNSKLRKGAVFHWWAMEGESSGSCSPVGIVEFRDGTVAAIHVSYIKFLDSDQFNFPEDEIRG